MKKLLIFLLAVVPLTLCAQESFHRAEQDREITYWLLDPATHQFRISHDFTVTKVGQKSVHSFVRKGSRVSPDSKMIDLDTGKPLKPSIVTGAHVNALSYYPDEAEPDMVVVQALGRPLNFVTLPPGWMLTSVNIPAVISLDSEGRVLLRFTNTRNGDLAIVIKARKRAIGK